MPYAASTTFCTAPLRSASMVLRDSSAAHPPRTSRPNQTAARDSHNFAFRLRVFKLTSLEVMHEMSASCRSYLMSSRHYDRSLAENQNIHRSDDQRHQPRNRAVDVVRAVPLLRRSICFADINSRRRGEVCSATGGAESSIQWDFKKVLPIPFGYRINISDNSLTLSFPPAFIESRGIFSSPQ